MDCAMTCQAVEEVLANAPADPRPVGWARDGWGIVRKSDRTIMLGRIPIEIGGLGVPILAGTKEVAETHLPHVIAKWGPGHTVARVRVTVEVFEEE